VADVYDALTADRVYREAWPAERALALLEDETGTAFDPTCVAALRGIVASEQPQLSAAQPVPERTPAPVRTLPSPLFGEAAA
jgi:HD-GYP domain-containing protein (c-di-GMP phosphodiesterase class II)